MKTFFDNGYYVNNLYLYVYSDGQLRMYEGDIYRRTTEKSTRASFFIKNHCGDYVKKLQCSVDEGKVCNKNVWLSERNVKKASEILIKYEEQQIAELRFKIADHEVVINTLKQY